MDCMEKRSFGKTNGREHATNGRTLRTCKNGQVRAHKTKKEGTQKSGSAQCQSTDPRKEHTDDVQPLDMGHEREPKYGEHGTVPATRECLKCMNMCEVNVLGKTTPTLSVRIVSV